MTDNVHENIHKTYPHIKIFCILFYLYCLKNFMIFCCGPAFHHWRGLTPIKQNQWCGKLVKGLADFIIIKNTIMARLHCLINYPNILILPPYYHLPLISKLPPYWQRQPWFLTCIMKVLWRISLSKIISILTTSHNFYPPASDWGSRGCTPTVSVEHLLITWTLWKQHLGHIIIQLLKRH